MSTQLNNHLHLVCKHGRLSPRCQRVAEVSSAKPRPIVRHFAMTLLIHGRFTFFLSVSASFFQADVLFLALQGERQRVFFRSVVVWKSLCRVFNPEHFASSMFTVSHSRWLRFFFSPTLLTLQMGIRQKSELKKNCMKREQ